MTLQLGHRETKGRVESFWADWSGRMDVAAESGIDIATAMLGHLTDSWHVDVCFGLAPNEARCPAAPGALARSGRKSSKLL